MVNQREIAPSAKGGIDRDDQTGEGIVARQCTSYGSSRSLTEPSGYEREKLTFGAAMTNVSVLSLTIMFLQKVDEWEPPTAVVVVATRVLMFSQGHQLENPHRRVLKGSYKRLQKHLVN
ncbi:hypothetical protein FRC12_001276, partial [Ceratobasidium sp. 428]